MGQEGIYVGIDVAKAKVDVAVRPTRSSWRTWPRKLRRKVPRACPRESGGLDGALTTHPSASRPAGAQHVGVVNAVAASQRGCHQGQHLVARVRPPRRISEVNVVVDEFTQTQVLGEGDRKEQPGIGHQAVVVKGDLDPVWVVAWEHLLGAPGLGSVLSFQNHYPRSTGALSYPFSTPRHSSFRWIGVEAASGFLVLPQAVDDDSIHFGKLLGGEVCRSKPRPCAWRRPSSQPGSVVCLFEDALRFLVQDHPAVDEGIAGGLKTAGFCLAASKRRARISPLPGSAGASPRSR